MLALLLTYAPDIAALLRYPRLLVAHLGERRDAVADGLLVRHREAQPQVRFRVVRADRPRRALIEDYARVGRRLQQLPHVHRIRQLDPQEDAALGNPAFRG